MPGNSFKEYMLNEYGIPMLRRYTGGDVVWDGFMYGNRGPMGLFSQYQRRDLENLEKSVARNYQMQQLRENIRNAHMSLLSRETYESPVWQKDHPKYNNMSYDKYIQDATNNTFNKLPVREGYKIFSSMFPGVLDDSKKVGDSLGRTAKNIARHGLRRGDPNAIAFGNAITESIFGKQASWKFWGMRKTADLAYNKFFDALKSGELTEDSQLWKDFTKSYTDKITRGLSKEDATKAIAKDKQANPDRWDPAVMRRNLQTHAGKTYENTNSWIDANKGRLKNFKWSKPSTWGTWMGGKLVNLGEIEGKAEDWKRRYAAATDPYEKIKLQSEWEGMQKALKQHVDRGLVNTNDYLAPATYMWENSLIGSGVNGAVRLATGNRHNFTSLTVGKNKYGDKLTAEDLYRETGAIDPTHELTQRGTGYLLRALNTAGEIYAMNAPSKFMLTPQMTGGGSLINGSVSVTQRLSSLAQNSRLANMGYKAMQTYKTAEPWAIGLGGVYDMGTRGGQVMPENKALRWGMYGIDAARGIAESAPLYSAATGAMPTMSPATTTTGKILQWTGRQGGTILTNQVVQGVTGYPTELTKNILGLIADKSDMLGREIYAGDEQEVLRRANIDIMTDPERRQQIISRFGLPEDSTPEQLRSFQTQIFGINRRWQADQAALHRLDSSVDWNNMSAEDIKAKISSYGQDAWDKARFDALSNEMQRGGVMDPALFEDLNDMNPDMVSKLFENWLMAEDRAQSGFLKGNIVGQAIRGGDSLMDKVMSSSPENRAFILSYAKHAFGRQVDGTWTKKQGNAGAQQVLLSNLNNKELDYVIGDKLRKADANSIVNLGTGPMRGVPDNVTNYAHDIVRNRLQKDANFAVDVYNAVGTRLKDGTMVNNSLVSKIAKDFKTGDPDKFFKSMDLKHFEQLATIMAAHGDSDKSPLPGVSDAEWATMKTKYMDAAKRRAWGFVKENPLKSLPVLAGMFGTMNGWKSGLVDAIKSPWVFWGTALAVLAGGALLFGGLFGDDDDDAQDNNEDRITSSELEAQRRLLANNTAVGIGAI